MNDELNQYIDEALRATRLRIEKFDRSTRSSDELLLEHILEEILSEQRPQENTHHSARKTG